MCKAPKFFYQNDVDICSPKSMFYSLYNHFKYYTLNPCNRLKSIANQVKLYNLGFTENERELAHVMLFAEDDYYGLCMALLSHIAAWEEAHINYRVYFNGRTDGYIVLGNKGNFGSVIDSDLNDYLSGFDSVDEAYSAFKQYVHDNGWSVKEYIYEMRAYVTLVREFDTLCDELRQIVIDYTNGFIRANRTKEASNNGDGTI